MADEGKLGYMFRLTLEAIIRSTYPYQYTHLYIHMYKHIYIYVCACVYTTYIYIYIYIPTSTFYSEIKEVVIQKWQKDWDKCTKAAITKELFPNVRERLKMKIGLNPNFTAMVTGHGRTRAYRYRFNLIDKAACPCNNEDQTVDQLIHQCTLLHINRQLKANVQRAGNWPATNQELITKHLKSFLTFTKSINFDEL